jgi:hypothetical protein
MQADTPKVLVELDREQAEHLFERCTESTNAPKINGYSCENCRAIGETLRAALSSTQLEVREEFTKVATLADGSDWRSASWHELTVIENLALPPRWGATDVRIQKRTVSESPWRDLKEESE